MFLSEDNIPLDVAASGILFSVSNSMSRDFWLFFGGFSVAAFGVARTQSNKPNPCNPVSYQRFVRYTRLTGISPCVKLEKPSARVRSPPMARYLSCSIQLVFIY